MKIEPAVAILASEGLAQVAVSCQHARRSFVPQCTICFFVKTEKIPRVARVNQVTSASLGYPLSVFNKNSSLKTD